jgi:hypothetical protein
MEMHEITYYKRHVDDIIIIFDQNKINEDLITSYMNNKHKHLDCKPTAEKNKNINLSRPIHTQRQQQPPNKDLQKTHAAHTTIHFTSNHPLEYKLAAYNFYTNRMLSTPITEQARQQEWDTICTSYK